MTSTGTERSFADVPGSHTREKPANSGRTRHNARSGCDPRMTFMDEPPLHILQLSRQPLALKADRRFRISSAD